MRDRSYQEELIQLVRRNNALITLPTGSGKTHIAARIMQLHYLPQLREAKARGQPAKALVFLAPTNPLVAQQCMMLQKYYDIAARAYHGDVAAQSISTWHPDKWAEELAAADVLVMTPEVLLHVLAHGTMQMQQIGLLVFDEAHHCVGNHAYCQIMVDFYHTAAQQQRPQILGLTASPTELLDPAEPHWSRKSFKKGQGGGSAALEAAGWDLQQRLAAPLLTVAPDLKGDMKAYVLVPENVSAPYYDPGPDVSNGTAAIQQALDRLDNAKKQMMEPAEKCEKLLLQLQRQAMLQESGQLQLQQQEGADATAAAADLACFAGTDDSRPRASMTALCTQVRGTRACLGELGAWPAAAAAHLDLLRAMADSKEADADADGMASRSLDEEDDGDAAVANAARRVVEGQDDDEAEVPEPGDGSTTGGLVDLEVMKRMTADDIGNAPSKMIAALRANLGSIVSYLQSTSKQYPGIISSSELQQATADMSDSSTQGCTVAQLAAAAPLLLALVSRAALLLVLSVLSELLMHGRPQQQLQLLQEAGQQLTAAGPISQRQATRLLQHYSTQLLAQVPFDTLQAQMWPYSPASLTAAPWQGPPLLSAKVKALLLLLTRKKDDAGLPDAWQPQQQQQQPEDWWSAIVFVKTKLSAFVLTKLLQSCPDIRQQLRAGYLIGDTDYSGGSSTLAMNTKAQAAVVGRFRSGELNVLIATNVGSEGMDFQQCELVVAFEPPTDVTQYIQMRGRARKRGSKYCWLVRSSSPTAEEEEEEEEEEEALYQPIQTSKPWSMLKKEAKDQERLAAKLSAATRIALASGVPAVQQQQQQQQQQQVLQPKPEDYLATDFGARATLRLA
uniref:P-loop containing nucleoside triphosphate hydrolase protein n=1 Tax=Tetradesmus obliquus TaxID=3088 RepID=A0A383WL31_TETOB|eukprot:jgi/Sobl393_1/17900/SZX72370.1